MSLKVRDIESFLIGSICILIPFIVGVISSWKKKPQPIIPFSIRIEPVMPTKQIGPVVPLEKVEPKPKPKLEPKPKKEKPEPKPKVDKTAFNEAKAALVNMGYKVASAKLALESVGVCDSAEEYLQKVFSKGRTQAY